MLEMYLTFFHALISYRKRVADYARYGRGNLQIYYKMELKRIDQIIENSTDFFENISGSAGEQPEIYPTDVYTQVTTAGTGSDIAA